MAATGYTFTTTTPATHARVYQRTAHARARTLRDVFGWSRPFDPGVLPPEVFDLMKAADVLEPRDGLWASRIRLSTLDGQLYAHSAYPTVQDDSVFFGPDTYRYADAVKQHLAGRGAGPARMVDVGCGAGPGAILAGLAVPGAEIVAVDINDRALALTRVNAAVAGAANVQACHSNLLDGVDGEFDLVMSNPPYLVDPHARAYRHGGGPLGAELSLAIIDAGRRRLKPGGSLLLYTGAAMVDGTDPFLAAVSDMLADGGLAWRYRELDPDIFGEELSNPAYAECDRIAAVLLTATRVYDAEAG
ncbi:methyltransferase [Pigmentiphaga humi]|uniref:methyltransferase n=1 Tax=Pigmentiphaga humi TaxID=2478468 RepID=UPI001FE6F622|nr:class I SAM-dependent methyltransferase [Pigmentiphaga humi]